MEREKTEGVKHYAVVIHKDPEGGHWGEVPALPGCYSQGETVDDPERDIREAITGVVEVLKEPGRRCGRSAAKWRRFAEVRGPYI